MPLHFRGYSVSSLDAARSDGNGDPPAVRGPSSDTNLSTGRNRSRAAGDRRRRRDVRPGKANNTRPTGNKPMGFHRHLGAPGALRANGPPIAPHAGYSLV
ncbi:Tex-like protein [Mycolicibacterium thermoresistibile]|uniref:Tex-like protein n=1 Tax=Mycolicibacterium thermoresistibile TaxID=1797 RepID=A0A100XAL9_MYCTH|nr:Tex-like protein [Mycolicibacterium thermoresistibile]